jgi:phosphoglycolate phosphatase-like HAD superfamily hydrolase
LRTRITARENYERGKLSPDPLIVACKAAGVELAKAIFVGDSWPDLVASQAAGCTFLLYSPKGAPTEQRLQGAPYIASHYDIWRYI